MPDTLRKEIKYIAAAFVAAAIMLKIAYYNEGFFEIIKTAASLFWLFVLPGYAITLYWRESLGFLERIFAGTVAAFAIIGIASYYLGISGLKIQNQTILLPIAIIAVSYAACLKARDRKSQQPQQEQKRQK